MQKQRCSCCGYYTLTGVKSAYDWDICPVCFWENDTIENDPEGYSRANHMTLAEGKENYQKLGICRPVNGSFVRLPTPDEYPENNEGEK